VNEASPDSAAGAGTRQPIWTRPDRGTRGPAPTHSRTEIVEAAIALADADGLSAVSMRAVAAALGTSAGSLYRYLSSRDDLLDLMTDQVVGQLLPYSEGDGDWLDAMLLLARQQLALYRRHRWLLDVTHRTSGLGPQGLAWFDNQLRILQTVRCSVTTKFEAIAMMTGVISLFARSETTSGSITFAGVDLTAYPHLAAAVNQPPTPSSRGDLFDRTLRSVLTGLLLTDSAVVWSAPGP
jgi:AcrR family transcriptional regulator